MYAAKCMDFYSQQMVAEAEGSPDTKPIDSRYLRFFKSPFSI